MGRVETGVTGRFRGIGPNSADIADIWPNPGQNWTALCRLWSSLGRISPNFAKLGPNLGQILDWPILAQCGLSLTNVGPNSAEFGRHRPIWDNLSQLWAEIDHA